jgi:hypothetical protein
MLRTPSRQVDDSPKSATASQSAQDADRANRWRQCALTPPAAASQLLIKEARFDARPWRCVWRGDRIAVGMPITGHPPHRTGRAAFPHPAPTLDV